MRWPPRASARTPGTSSRTSSTAPMTGCCAFARPGPRGGSRRSAPRRS
ncbi:hypothetical protein ACFFX0_04790 [Citricoccus parietis]|uniref:Uncharacterized protein n=1 Tax=Citricoccus parietis TaxID=592307 RepID=A0ABV5FV52_9MICC